MVSAALQALIGIGPAHLDGLTDSELRRVVQRATWLQGMARQRLEQRNATFTETSLQRGDGVVTFVGSMSRQRSPQRTVGEAQP